jgi:sulfur-carrier protein adenylyltransferase/sulfurtransferase
VLNCAEAGVLGVLPGIIGVLQASEAIKLVAGTGQPLVNQLLTYNVFTNQQYVIELLARAGTRLLIPADETAFRQTNYEWLCGAGHDKLEIDITVFNKLIEQAGTVVIDVRELHELPLVTEFKHRRIPLSLLTEQAPAIQENTVVLFCQSGKRSLQAARQLADMYKSRTIYSLTGGIVQWKKQAKMQAL